MMGRGRLTIAAVVAAALLAATAAAPAQNGDAATIKQALELLRGGDGDKALALPARDPAARALIQWLAIRLTPKDIGFARTAGFIREHPDWPNQIYMRRRAERLLYDDKPDAKIVRGYFAKDVPVSGEGKLALARALLASGDRTRAQALVRSAWHGDDLSKEIESETLAAFPGMLSAADHKARADRFFYKDNYAAGLRAAARAGAELAAYAQARVAVIRRAGNAAKLLAAVPARLHNDPGYLFARIQYLRRKDEVAAAAKLLLAAPRDPKAIVDPDEWWVERRLIARKLLDQKDARTAYRVASQAAQPERENFRIDREFTSGWIALRFLKDHAAALRHFAEIKKFTRHPISLARGHYWHGRAAEAAGDKIAAIAEFDRAARHQVAYYGQLARTRLGHKELALTPPAGPSQAARAAFEREQPVRAIRLLYAAGEPELALSMLMDLAERARDLQTAQLLAELAHAAQDARGLVFMAKAAFGRGLSLDAGAFPTFAMPSFTQVGPAVDQAIVYAIARQESAFNPRAVSSAGARGLMQLMPPTARAVAKKYGIAFNLGKLLGDPAFNLKIGSAELGDLLQAYRGSYILAFAAYNAGRSRVNGWIQQYGDPRDPSVDAVDWVERIPFSETRNYVQRVMENVQVYKVRLAKGAPMIDAELSRGGVR
jgi:soluble lytic murein transglycosylase